MAISLVGWSHLKGIFSGNFSLVMATSMQSPKSHLKGIFSGNFSLVMATSKQSPKSMWRIFPEFLSSSRFEGCLSPKQNLVYIYAS
jgi:hypothetical protein